MEPDAQIKPLTISDLLEQTHDKNPRVRKEAVKLLCPCEVKFDSDEVWDRLFEMVEDEDDNVRSLVFHNFTDGVPKERNERAVAVIESMAHDPHAKLRRRVRKTLARYRRTGNLDHTVR